MKRKRIHIAFQHEIAWDGPEPFKLVGEQLIEPETKRPEKRVRVEVKQLELVEIAGQE